MWQCLRVSRSWHATFRESKPRPLAKRRTAKPATKRASPRAEVRTGSVRSAAPPSADAGRPFDVSRWKVGRIAPGERTARTLAARRNHQTAFWTFLKLVQERALPLVEDVEIDGALVAYSNDCFVQECSFTMVHSFFAAAIDRWLSGQPLWVRKLRGSIDV